MTKAIMRWHLSQQIKGHFLYFFHLCFLGRIFCLYKTWGAVTHLSCDGFELSQLDFHWGQQQTPPVHVPKRMLSSRWVNNFNSSRSLSCDTKGQVWETGLNSLVIRMTQVVPAFPSPFMARGPS